MLKADSNALAPVKDDASLGCTGILPVEGRHAQQELGRVHLTESQNESSQTNR
jgi:hypothetical protein